MEAKSLRRIRKENIKRLEESLPPLQEKLARADLEKKFCPSANPETGVCDVPEKRAQQLVAKFAQEHRTSSLIAGASKEPTWKAGGDLKRKKKGETVSSVDEIATIARDNMINNLKEENRRLVAENTKLEQFIEALRDVRLNFDFSDLDDEEEEEKGTEGEKEA